MKKENEAIKDRIIRDIRNLSEHEKEDKPVRVGNFWSRNYIEYENNYRNKTLSIKEYLNKIRPCLTLYVHIFYLVLEKLYFGFSVCMKVAKKNSIEKIGKEYFFLEI